jgi:hypothetical protein
MRTPLALATGLALAAAALLAVGRAHVVSAGQRVVDHLLERREGVEVDRASTGLLENALVIRESTGPVRPGGVQR